MHSEKLFFSVSSDTDGLKVITFYLFMQVTKCLVKIL